MRVLGIETSCDETGVAVYSAAESDQPAERIFHHRVGEDAVTPTHSATINVK